MDRRIKIRHLQAFTEIVRQRSRAMTALGNVYDLRAFDDAVVLGGNASLDVLAKNIDRYIAGA